MNAFERSAHGLVVALGTLFRMGFQVAIFLEDVLRNVLGQAGIGRDEQSLVLLMTLGSAMYAAMRLLRGVVRVIAIIVLIVLLFELMLQFSDGMAQS